MYFIWIVLYQWLFWTLEALSHHFQFKNSGILIALVIYISLFYKWIKKSGDKEAIALKKSKVTNKKLVLYYLPLTILPIYNCITVEQQIIEFSFYLLILCVAIIEEIFFRGVLYQLLEKWSKCGYIILSSLLFAFFHLVNIYEGMEWQYVFFQMLSAFTAGICYASLVICEESIYSCIVFHFLTNVTAGNGVHVEIDNLYSFKVYGLCICMIVHIWYGIWIYKNVRGK